MKYILKYTGYILLLFIVGFLIWRFWFLMVWVLIAVVISFAGQPFVKFFDRLHIKKWKFPHALSALFSLVILVLLFFSFLSVFVPLIVNQAENISRVDVDKLAENLQGPLQWIDNKMHTFGVIPADQTMQDFITAKAKLLVNLGSVTTLIANFFSVAGTVLVGLFSVLFIAFFFLKDENMFEEIIFLLVPVKHHKATHQVVTDSKNLLKRYFIGVLLELLGVMSIITIGLWILGVENALLIGFFGGLMNIIPYLGPVIGALIAITLSLTATLSSGAYNEVLPVLLKLGGVLLGANFIDNNILMPLIYSKSVKSHPLEIFFVIIIAGNLAGLLGMLVAVPVYTVLRVIGREFFQQFRLVKKLTETMDE